MNPHRALLIGETISDRSAVTDNWLSPHSEVARCGRARRIRRCPLFRNVGLAQIQTALESAATRRVSRGGFYFRQGDRAREAYVLIRGRVKLVRSGSDTRRGILGFVSPLEPFGYEDALGTAGRTASAQASEDTEALVWPATTLVRIIAGHPVIAHNSLRLMAERIQGMWGRLQGLLTESLERRTARALLALGARLGRTVDGGAAIELRLPRQDLAAFVGATPYAMSRIVSRWRRLGIVDAGRGWVVVWPRRLAGTAREHWSPRGQR